MSKLVISKNSFILIGGVFFYGLCTRALTFQNLWRHNGTLAWLVLEENQVGDIGGLALGHALLSNTALHGLSLKDNLIHDATGTNSEKYSK